MFAAKPGRLIVSCQPSTPDSPLNAPQHMAAMAAAAEAAGATALRVNSPEHVVAVKAVTTLPVIGLWKRADGRGQRVITPDLESARALAEAGADVIALDATAEAHGVPGRLAMLIQSIHDELMLPVMADISTVAEGVRAVGYGADLVGTTLSGYTPYSPQQAGPDLNLVRELAEAVTVPVVAEGRYTSPEQARAALLAGAAFVVVGNALTAPDVAAARFIAAMEPEAGPLTAERCWAETFVAIAQVQATQGPAVREAAALCAGAILAGGSVHFAGAGLPGGLTSPADVFIVAGGGGDAGSGAVGGSVGKLALDAKRRGHGLIAIGSLAQARRHPDGRQLLEFADVFIDNADPAGTASGVTGALIAQALKVETDRLIKAAGAGSDRGFGVQFPNAFG
ncbi:MAG TPA: putative N-acetylmannosamine-6-phosphate 2-epimerase [Symbiobacteriaceae bacterium]